MSRESNTRLIDENAYSVEEIRRNNLLDNQKFLQSLKIGQLSDDLKSTVSLTIGKEKSTRRKSNQKDAVNRTDLRRSLRIQTMIENQHDDSRTDGTSNDEEEKNSPKSRLANKIDREWKPTYHVDISPERKITLRKPKRPVSNGVKIFLPNIGLKASAVASAVASGMEASKIHVSKKINVAISSSDDE